jgi:hypothetical protein
MTNVVSVQLGHFMFFSKDKKLKTCSNPCAKLNQLLDLVIPKKHKYFIR